ncbi:MAG TPA: adenosylcobinamide amidohydrolase [Terriglobales bacterium]|jgi:adenosylcobinamide amidohydrolase
MHWEVLRATNEHQLRRYGRFLVVELLRPHHVISTSRSNGGQHSDIRYLVNHQSCEGKDHKERQSFMMEMGLDQYHDSACREIALDPSTVALMGTAANMNYASVVERKKNDIAVTAVVTAGVQGNAACAGDPTTWRETQNGWEKTTPYAGTINTILLLNQPLAEGAIAGAVVTMTEAKTAALQKLSIRSLYSPNFATGTTTDQFCIAAPQSGAHTLKSTSTGVQLGELIALAVRDATLEALRWQNGLEVSYTRSIFHALGSYGLKESNFFADIAPFLDARNLELLKANANSVFYEPLVAAAAYAAASVLDRLRHGTLPPDVAKEALRQQAATLAANLSARRDCWPEFYSQLAEVDVENPKGILLAAIAAGWSAKWR